MWLIFIAGIIALIIYLIQKKNRCKNCGASGSCIKEISRKTVAVEDIRKLKETDSRGVYVQPYYVYGKRTVTRTTYRCSNCGNTTWSDYTYETWDDDHL